MSKPRILILFLVFSAAWLALVLRAAQLQILPDEKLASLKKRQFRTIVELPSRRGSLLDRNGKEMAVSVPAYSLYADPQMIDKPKELARFLASLLGASYQSLYNKVKKSDRRFVWLQRRLDKSVKDKILTKKFKGIGFVEESRRVYPNNDLFSQGIGFIGSEGKGLEGLELHFDSYLRGTKRILRVERDARGRPLVVDGQVFTEMPAGADVELTIDSELQFVLEKSLRESIETFNADGAIGIVMDVHTNEILAMAQAPTFDANRALRVSKDLWRNKLATDIFEPGSVIKTMVIGGALDSGVLRPSTLINCENGQFKIGRRIIREADSKHKFGNLSVSEVLAKSSNVGTSKIALQLGDAQVRKILENFGFGSVTGMDYPGEAAGILHKLPWRDHLLANVSFGHGMAATPVQVANAYVAIANGGELRTPVLVRGIRSAETGEEVTFHTQKIRRVLSEQSAATLRLMLTEVTGPGGTGVLARVPGFPVAGKTGTAQKVDENGGYKRGAYISSFAGMIPSNDPKFVIYVAVDNPREKYYGSEVAAPLFARVAAYAVRRSGLSPILISEENILRPEVAEQKNAVDRIREIAKALKSHEENRVPDLTGLSLREALNRIRGSELKIKITGKGVVAEMNPAPGEILPEDRTLHVKLE